MNNRTLDARIIELEALAARQPAAHNMNIILTEMILCLMVGVMILMLGVVIYHQREMAARQALGAMRGQQILNNQEIMAANIKWANGMIHARCSATADRWH
jgi:hypothetical protein